MKIYTSALSMTGFVFFALGGYLNVRMLVIEAWPTYLFFIYMAFGIFMVLIDIPIRKSNRISANSKILIQVLIALVLFLFL